MRKVTLFEDYEITVDIEQSGDDWRASYAIETHGELIKRRRNFVIKATSRADSVHIALAQAKAYIARSAVSKRYGPAVQSSRSGTSRQYL